MAIWITLILVTYLLGSVPSAYLAGKWSRGIDIRQYGSGNVGATNLLRFTSRRTTVPVIVFDSIKGMIAVTIAWQVGLGLAVRRWLVWRRLSGITGRVSSVFAVVGGLLLLWG